MVNDITQFALILAVMTGLVVVLGKWITRLFTSPSHTRAERATYGVLGVDPAEGMSWQRYSMALLCSNAAMMLLGYVLLRLQQHLPGDALQRASQSPDLAFNTAASFITNTNWQSYSGETSLSNFSQMAVITFLMMVSAATGVAAAGGFIRGLSRKSAQDIGNYWVDFTRATYRLLLPISFGLALVYVWQGIPQTLSADASVTTLEGARQQLVMGPVASLEAIKHVGTNGGGFFGMNAAHPFENPTPLTNTLHILSMLLIPSSLTYAFGSMVLRRQQGWAFFGAFLVMFIGFLAVVYGAERGGNPLLAQYGVDQVPSALQAGGNMEGKELRFGIAQTSLFVAVTTAATTGSVNAMHSSLTPLGGLVPLSQMMLNNVFGGDGVGFINLITFALLTVFLVGMMIGRTPEFLGKKIEAREVQLVMLAMLAHAFGILGFTALACIETSTLQSVSNLGPHGFSEVLYAYTSGTANNGSAFAGFNANTPFLNTTIGLAMLMGRYLTLFPMLAVAGSLAAKKTLIDGPGTMSTATPLFTGLLVFVVIVVGGLTFLPALALGPIVEHLLMRAGATFLRAQSHQGFAMSDIQKVVEVPAAPSTGQLARPALTSAILFMLVAGLVYPLATTASAQLLFAHQARGSLIQKDGHLVGSEMVGQYFTRPEYFHGRPSVTSGSDPEDASKVVAQPYNAGLSAASNQGALSKSLSEAVADRARRYRAENGLTPDAAVPVDAVTASASGLDPDISLANAYLQARRIARARGASPEQLETFVREHVRRPQLGVLGDPRVNVLQLNLALDAAFPLQRPAQ